MEIKNYKKGEIIFRQGDDAKTMFTVLWGRVGIFLDYGTGKEKKLAELEGEGFFGEMGLLDHEPRSATAVALAKDTRLLEFDEASLANIFQEKPAKVLMVMQGLSRRLRQLTHDYMEVCKTASELIGVEKAALTAENEVVQDLIDEAEKQSEHHNQLLSRGYFDYV